MTATLAAAPLHRAGWVSAVPSAPSPGSERRVLAPGVWTVRRKSRPTPNGPISPGLVALWWATPRPPWHPQAACHAHPDADAVFFGAGEHHPTLAPTAIELAKAMCHSCPVVVACLTWALEARHEQADGFISTGEEFGIWGGTTGRQRAKLQKRRKLGASVAELVAECLPQHDQ
jgi:WhiB family redox-sensing transcriptional regulator